MTYVIYAEKTQENTQHMSLPIYPSIIYGGRASQVTLVVKNPPANSGDIRDEGSIPVSVRSPGEGNGNPLYYSCLENPMDRDAQQGTIHGVTKSQMQLKGLSTQALMHSHRGSLVARETSRGTCPPVTSP